MGAPGFDAQRFREALAHYPTGIVVTAIDSDGEPVGMVVDSFTSVFLDPPLLAYLPMRSARVFTRLRAAACFCVNVLGADQEDTCRVFASNEPDPLANLSRHSGPGGAPILRVHRPGL